jgi:hypothetical protein
MILGNADGYDFEIESTNINFTDIIFRASLVDLSLFSLDGSGAECEFADFGETQGTLAIGPAPELPGVQNAEMRFGFTAPLNGKSTQYYLTMRGASDDIGNWFPAAENTIYLAQWEIVAENRKARKTGCYGTGSTPVAVTVSPSG